MEATCTLAVWPDPPNDEDATDRGQIFKCIREEWKVQVKDMREEAAAAEAAKVNKDDGGEDDKDNGKQTKSKPKQTSCRTKGKQKSSSSKKVNLPDDNLNEFFGLSLEKNSQETADAASTDPPKKSEETESKDEPKVPAVDRSHQGSGGEGSPEPSSKSKGSPQQVKKLEAEDSSYSQLQGEDKDFPSIKEEAHVSIPTSLKEKVFQISISISFSEVKE